MKSNNEIRVEISTWEYLANTLTQPHQQNVKNEILQKVKSLKYQLIKNKRDNKTKR